MRRTPRGGIPFTCSRPIALLLPLTTLATAATVVASQATISGAYSVTRQASRLGYLPRIPVVHTSATEQGQIYISQVNWVMRRAGLVLGFRSSGNLAAAYGIAVSGTMLLTTILIGIVVVSVQGAAQAFLVFPVLLLMGGLEIVFLASDATKIPAGGWFPLACGLVLYVVLSTWKTGAELVSMDQRRMRVPLGGLVDATWRGSLSVPGTAIFFSADAESAPATLLHVLKHFKVVDERVILITIINEDVPRVPEDGRTDVRVLEPRRRYQVILRYGFMENPDIPRELKLLERRGRGDSRWRIRRSSSAAPRLRGRSVRGCSHGAADSSVGDAAQRAERRRIFRASSGKGRGAWHAPGGVSG